MLYYSILLLLLCLASVSQHCQWLQAPLHTRCETGFGWSTPGPVWAEPHPGPAWNWSVKQTGVLLPASSGTTTAVPSTRWVLVVSCVSRISSLSQTSRQYLACPGCLEFVHSIALATLSQVFETFQLYVGGRGFKKKSLPTTACQKI